MTVTFTPASGPVNGVLTIPVSSTTSGGDTETTNLAVPLTGSYTTQNSGLEIVPNIADFGPQTTGAAGLTRQFTINNLTGAALSLNVALPRQFVLAGAPCTGVAANGTCTFSATFLPMTNGSITGTITAVGAPNNGATVSGLGYMKGYGLGAGMLAITGNLQQGELVNFLGRCHRGQLGGTDADTSTNAASTTPLTVRRATSQWPFLSTTTCGAAMAPGASCAVALTYFTHQPGRDGIEPAADRHRHQAR